jgi:lysophospholipase L1-like esterase
MYLIKVHNLKELKNDFYKIEIPKKQYIKEEKNEEVKDIIKISEDMYKNFVKIIREIKDINKTNNIEVINDILIIYNKYINDTSNMIL